MLSALPAARRISDGRQHKALASSPTRIAVRLRGILAWLSLVAIAVAVAAPAAFSQSSPSGAKCQFLRNEEARLGAIADSILQQEPLASAERGITYPGSIDPASLAWTFIEREKALASQRIRGLEFRACRSGISLADPSRLPQVNDLSQRHLQLAAAEWDRITQHSAPQYQDPVAQAVRTMYEDEARSFYRPTSELPGATAEVRKDFPDLADRINGSALDPSTKNVLVSNLGLLRYEEAGELRNSLQGIGGTAGVGFAYNLRRDVEGRASERAQAQLQAAARQTDELRKNQSARSTSMALTIAIVVVLCLILAVPVYGRVSYAAAKYHAFKTGAKRVPFSGGAAELILWDPGETVVILEHKRLVPLVDPGGGYRTISAWRGQEYKGRITYKTHLLPWKSDPIFTSDGLTVTLTLGIWWRIANANTYVSAIASDFHEGSQREDESLTEAAEYWISKLAAGTLREHVSKLPASSLISPYVQTYLQVRSGAVVEAIPQFSELLNAVQTQLDEKTRRYGIEVERLEVQQLHLPQAYQEKLEAVRTTFLEPDQSRAQTEAQVIALQGLASVIGADRVGLIEILKHVDLGAAAANPLLNVVSMIQPMASTVQQEVARALAPSATVEAKKLPAAPDPAPERPPEPPAAPPSLPAK